MGQKGRGDITPERCAERRAEGDRTSCGSKSRVGFKCIISARYTHMVDSMCGTATKRPGTHICLVSMILAASNNA